ncbi:hypothetical protein AKO1_012399 [Acrasis kona]|uniref:FZ domain-containing protein n=1 Tax=Acrasis kona TaxID=1008807 RepID=A0AAW2YWF7_9EUKA
MKVVVPITFLLLLLRLSNAIYTTGCTSCQPAVFFPKDNATFCGNYIDDRDNLCYDNNTVAILDMEISSLYARTYRQGVEEAQFGNLYVVADCIKYAKRFLCAHYFPRCSNSNFTSPSLNTTGTSMGICYTLCSEYYNKCNSAELVSFRCGNVENQWNKTYPSSLYTGNYPKDACTGSAGIYSPNWMLLILSIVVLMSI